MNQAPTPSSDRDEMLRAALGHPEARVLLFRGEEALLETEGPVRPVLVHPRDLDGALDRAVLLGDDGGRPRLALDVEDGDPRSATSRTSGTFRSLHGLQQPIEPDTWSLLARGRALLAWHRSHRMCSVCGAPTRPQQAGMIRVCSSPTCERIHHPRTDPSVIVRVIRGERCLLARQPRFPPGRRSVLAGFVEPGETLEDAVRREVREEVGLEVGRVTYLGSQPWPFPMSLMIAFEAEARTDAIHLDDEELEAADWYTRDQVRREVNAGALILPSLKSISRRMIDEWLDGAAPLDCAPAD